jgi:glutamate racemase
MIGIFDSGSGGLTVLRAIRERLPSSDVLYFGDIKNAPYGARSRAELSGLTIAAFKYLTDHGATSLVSACNSVSASLAISLFDALPVPGDNIIEMVGPTVGTFRGSSERIVLFATTATIDSRLYQDGFQMLGIDVRAHAIPELAGAIERGVTAEEVRSIIEEATRAIAWSDVDTVILACTHYPLVADVFRALIPEHVSLFDPADAVAERVERKFWPREAGYGKTHFVISKDSDTFRAHVAHLFPDTQYTIEVVE